MCYMYVISLCDTKLLGKRILIEWKVPYNELYKKIDSLVSTTLDAVAKLLHVQSVF